MPPKGSKKPKAEDATQKAKVEDTPQKVKAHVAPASKPKAPPKQNSVPKKLKDSMLFKPLACDESLSVGVTFEGESAQAKLRTTGDYGQVLKLISPNSFNVVASVSLTCGDFAGMQAILIQPAQPFNFLKVPIEARKRIYEFYFAPKGVKGAEIVIEGKRSGKDSKDMFAKSYADGLKHRVGLLGVNKEVNEEAIRIFYAHQLRFDTTTTMSDFVVQIPTAVRSRLTSVAVNQWVKTTSRNAMMLLSEAKNMKSLQIEAGVSSDSDPNKAAKAFWADAYKFLEAVGAGKGDKAAAVDVLTFGQKAFVFKEGGDKKNPKPWAEAAVEDFREILRAKLR